MLIQSPKVRALEVAIPVAWRTALRAPSVPTTYRARIVVDGPGGAATLASIPPSAGCSPASSAPYRSRAPVAAARWARTVSRWSCAHVHTWSGKGTRWISGPVRQERIDMACSQWKPRRRTSGSAPQRRISCMVSEVSAVARGWLPEAGRRSRISGASPRPASSSAVASPAGPAPTTRTWTCSSSCPLTRASGLLDCEGILIIRVPS